MALGLRESFQIRQLLRLGLVSIATIRCACCCVALLVMQI
jgi:hypothetical protein